MFVLKLSVFTKMFTCVEYVLPALCSLQAILLWFSLLPFVQTTPSAVLPGGRRLPKPIQDSDEEENIEATLLHVIETIYRFAFTHLPMPPTGRAGDVVLCDVDGNIWKLDTVWTAWVLLIRLFIIQITEKTISTVISVNYVIWVRIILYCNR